MNLLKLQDNPQVTALAMSSLVYKTRGRVFAGDSVKCYTFKHQVRFIKGQFPCSPIKNTRTHTFTHVCQFVVTNSKCDIFKSVG